MKKVFHSDQYPSAVVGNDVVPQRNVPALCRQRSQAVHGLSPEAKYLRSIEELKQQQAVMEERHRTRQQISRDLHDDVASTISSISLYSDMIHRKRTVRKE
jgi:signal transduction histidine kinase